METDLRNESTEALLDLAAELLKKLGKLMLGRRNRDRACMTLTDLFLCVEYLGHRLGKIEFQGGPVASDDDEEADSRNDEQAPLSMTDLLSCGSSEATRIDDAMRQTVLDFEEAYDAIRDARPLFYGQFIDYLVMGCSTPEEVTRKLLAIARRVRPNAMKSLGISQVDVSRRLGEQRATTQAREKRVVEKTLKKSGAKSYSLLGGGKSAAHRAACKKAQKGNKNRAAGKRKRQPSAGDHSGRGIPRPETGGSNGGKSRNQN